MKISSIIFYIYIIIELTKNLHVHFYITSETEKNSTTNYVDIIHETEKIATNNYVDIIEYV